MTSFSRPGRWLILAALVICGAPSAFAKEFITRHCRDYGQPEIRFEVSDKTPAADAEWLLRTLEHMAAQGSRFRAGETIQIGWVVNRLEAAKRKTLRLVEPDMFSSPLTYQPSMSNTLRYTRLQKDTVESLEGDLPIVFSSMEHSAIVHTDYNNLRTLSLVREEPRGTDSGWRLLKSRDTLDQVSAEHYRTVSLYELALRRPDLIHLLALPPGITVRLEMDLQKSFFADERPIVVRAGSYMAQANAQRAEEDAAIEARFSPGQRSSRGLEVRAATPARFASPGRKTRRSRSPRSASRSIRGWRPSRTVGTSGCELKLAIPPRTRSFSLVARRPGRRGRSGHRHAAGIIRHDAKSPPP
jgi:hypothetical protein